MTVVFSDPTQPGTSAWPRLAALPLVVEGCEPARLERLERVTTLVRLTGAGADGLGEDVSGDADEHAQLIRAAPGLPVAGAWTLEGFCRHLGTLELWPAPPAWEAARRYRRWAFESAALDLALRQAGLALHEALAIEPRAVRFVTSFGLGDPPSADVVHRRRATFPGLRFKLDAAPDWSPALMAELAATGAIDVLDFKGHYGLEVGDPEPLVALYEHAPAAFPDALLEDPHDRPDIARLLAPYVDRVSYDAPIHGADDLRAVPLRARTVNVKPSRVGGLEALFGLYAHCAATGVRMYGGGMGELGVGRGQIQLLASLFHPDAPNDVAPSAFNAPEPDAGLSARPLDPRPGAAGFR